MRGALAAAATASALLLAGCGDEPVLFSTPSAGVNVAGTPADPGGRIAVGYDSIEVREVSLPTYASAEVIFFEGVGGALVPIEGAEWADLPPRAVTLDLVTVLDAVTGARVAAEPWPYESFPEGRIEVRATRMTAGADGLFRLSGQYYVADMRSDVETPRDRSSLFAIAVPYDMQAGASGIADARSRAVRDLARQIASNGL